jgi:predicted phage baseplate assembly protein
MPLPAPDLDDRKFQDIVDEAKRLIPRYCPEWTNHNLSDPGVALIELFAWMSEMVLFRINQVPERLYVHFLNMVGIEPFPPSVARVDETFWLSAVLETPVIVPAGTQVMTTVGANPANIEPVVFTTSQDLVIAPPKLMAAMTTTAAGDRATDVWDGVRFDAAGVPCFASPELTPGDAFCLGFAESLAGTALRLTIGAEARGIGVDPRNPPLAWEVWNGEAWLRAQVSDDTTGGLNRGGNVVLLIPVEHELLSIGNVAAYWVRVRLLEPQPGQPTYQMSPRVRAITAATLGGTVRAEHSENVPAEVVGRSDGRAAQSFTVSHTPVLPRRDGETVRVTDSDGATEWTEVEDFTRSTEHDRHFAWDSGSGVIRFGPRVRYADGTVRQHGRIPRDGAQISVTGYRHGGGARGNVGARTLTVMRSTVPFVRGAVNLTPAGGGVDPETIAEARVRGPLSLRTGERAVTVGDYERLALEASTEVMRARCLPAGRGNGSVRLLIVPAVRGDAAQHAIDDFAIPPPLLRRISEHLDEHRLVGTAIEVSTPYYQGISAIALVHAGPGRPAALVRQRAMDALTRFVNPLVGGLDGSGWPFDVDLNAAVVTQLLETVEGVERVDELLLFEYDLRTGQRLGTAKDVIRLDQHSLFLSAGHQVVVR